MYSQFELPRSLAVDKFIATLKHDVDLHLDLKQAVTKSFYDSFDWRLYLKGISCELNQAKLTLLLTLRAIDTGLVLSSLELKKVPSFSKAFEPGSFREILEPLLEMRALLPVCVLDYDAYHLNVFNKDQKIILRLLVEDYGNLNGRVFLQPVKGYAKAAESMGELLSVKLGLTAIDQSILIMALQQQGLKPKSYSSKLNINLDPDMRADIAGKYIYSHLLKAIKINEQGTIADTDSEFLHDFRVAIRRTRAGLSQIKGILPTNINAYYADFFSWLGQVTGPTRDLDVYLLSFEGYKNSLPASIREDLNALYDFLVIKQQKAHKELAKKLQSPRYTLTLSEWEQYLKEPSGHYPLEQNVKLTIKQLADQRIWKIFNRVLQEGNTITESSPAEALHDLRKTCKKLRYLMEFFQSLYAEDQIKQLIKNLKGLQEVLGDFQDYAVQEEHLRVFSEEMIALEIPANTFLAMGVLIQNLDARRCRSRLDFSAKFDAFRQEENRHSFKSLFAHSKIDVPQH